MDWSADIDDTFVPDASVCGIARIDGREVVIGGEDFTIKGGTEGSKKPRGRDPRQQSSGPGRCAHDRCGRAVGRRGHHRSRETRPRLIRALEASLPGRDRHLGPHAKIGVRP